MSNARENVNLLTSADWDIPTLRLANWGSGAVPPQVVLKTNYVAGDGGGLFRYDASDTTTADDGGIVIVDAAGNRWKRQFTGGLNPKFWGAIVSDSVSSQTAFANMAAYINANPIDTDVNFPASWKVSIDPGEYKLTALITITQPVTIQGSGMNSTVLKWTSPGGLVLSYTQPGGAQISVRDIELRAETTNAGRPLEITCPSTASTFWPRVILNNVLVDGLTFGAYWTNGIKLTNAWNSVVSNVMVIGKNDTATTNWLPIGIEIAGGTVAGMDIQDCEVQNAIKGYASTATHIEGFHFRYCYAIGVVDGFVFDAETGSDRPLDISIFDCHVAAKSTTNGDCIRFANGRSIQISNCELYFDKTSTATGSCIKFTDDVENAVLAGNRLIRTGATTGSVWGINLTNSNNYVIRDCEFQFFNTSGGAPIVETNTGTAAAISGNNRFYSSNAVSITGTGIAWERLGNAGGASVWNAGSAVARPLQPGFKAHITSDLTNQTGDGTAWSPVFGTEVYDRAGNYNASTGVFTAPVAGTYDVNLSAYLIGLSASHTDGSIEFVATGKNEVFTVNFGAARSASNNLCVDMSRKVYLAQGDTIYPRITVSNGSKTVGLKGDATNFYSSWSADLLF